MLLVQQLPRFTQITDVFGKPVVGSQDTSARPSRSYAVKQPPAGRGYLHAADVSSFWTESDGVSTHMGRYANNGRFVFMMREWADTGQCASLGLV